MHAWWIWLILALAMLAVLIAGIIYVIIHGLHALQSVQRTGEAVSERIALMSDTEAPDTPRSVPSSPSHSRWPPIDTRRPIRRWTNARRARRERYARIWSRWASFND